MATVTGSQRNKTLVVDTVNTGQGANELYAMDQNVRTSDNVTFNNVTISGSISGYATESYVGTQISNLVDSSPAALNTLNELAAALGDDANFSTTVNTNIATKLPLAGGAMTGAITTNSTFDGRDVATDGTKLDTIETNADVTDTTNVTAAGALMDSEVTNLAQVKAFDSSDYATAAQGTKADAALPTTGGTMTGTLGFGDAKVLTFGDSNDLNIYHLAGGSLEGSYIAEQGSGNLNIRANDLTLQANDTGATLATFVGGGAATLYHNNSAKIATTSTGIDVTGTVTANDLTLGDASPTINFNDSDLANLNHYITSASNANLYYAADSAAVATGKHVFTTQNVERFEISSTGIDVTGTVTAGSLSLGDSEKATFGASGDLEIYHNGSHSIIEDVGNGSLFIKGDTQVKLMNGSENAVLCQKNAGVTLYYDNSAKIVTTNTGIDVTGNLTVSGTVDGKDVSTLTRIKKTEFDLTPNSTSAFISGSSDSNVYKYVFVISDTGTSGGPNNPLLYIQRQGVNAQWIGGWTKAQGNDNYYSGNTDILNGFSTYQAPLDGFTIEIFKTNNRWVMRTMASIGQSGFYITQGVATNLARDLITGISLHTGSGFNWTSVEGYILEYFE